MEAETILSFAIGRLRDLLVKEGLYLQALTGPVEELREKLTEMEKLLDYTNVRRDKRLVEIIEMADNLMDSIEIYVVRVLSQELIGIRERLMRPKLCLAIENITTKINDLVNSQSGAQSNVEGARRAYKVQDLSSFNEKDFVGREEDVNNLVSLLVDQVYKHFRVISIYGMGGLGKTTLARKVYKEKKVLSHFKSFAFVCVSEQCQAEDVLKHILQQLVPEKEEDVKSMSEADVLDWLQTIQRERECLVIIDDIWSVHDWESLNCGLPYGSTGSKVVLTTRIKDVADKGFCYFLRCLSEDECWELCLKKLFIGREYQLQQRMEELGRKMIAWCRGIPLAVLVLRGVLVTKGSLPEWHMFYESRKWGGKGHDQFKGEVVEELLFSYKELPYPLKPCFLYLANFAEDEEVEADMLYRLWDAEGMLLSNDREAGETMMDVAERYLGELVGRSMVEASLEYVVHPAVKKRYKSCWLHDLMRELCLSIVDKENFLKVNDYRGRGDKMVVLDSSCLRNDTKISNKQALYFSLNQDFSVNDKQQATRHMRSLMFKAGHARKVSNLKKLNLLRVLRFDHTFIWKEEFINELIHLRYLSLTWCDIRKLPSSIENLIYLQTLDIRVYLHDFGVLVIPNLALRNLKRLRHLFLPKEYYYKVTPEFSRLGLDGLTELETLVNLDSTKCEIKDVIQLTSLRRLEWTIHISSEDDGEEFKGLMNKVNLDPSQYSSLEIVLKDPKIKIYSDVIRGQLPKHCESILRELKIDWLRGKLLPQFSNFHQIMVLTLHEFDVEEDPMPVLEQLSSLEKLSLWVGKLKGKEMCCSTMGFPRLEFLNFSSVENWEKWRVEEGAMPKLRYLWIEECKMLEMLPDGLKFITALKYLRVRGLPERFTRRLISGGDKGSDLYKIQHLHKVEIID